MLDPRTRKRPRSRLQTQHPQPQTVKPIVSKLFILTISWLPFLVIVLFTNPNQVKNLLFPDTYLAFFISLFIALFTTLKIISQHTRRSLTITLATIFFLYLRLFDIGNLLNLILIIILIVTLEAYLLSPNQSNPPPEENL